MRERSVVVVGAGIAGLGAAWQLSRRGFTVTVLERAQRAGGRVSTLQENGYAFDVGNPLLSTADRRMQAFIDEVGLRDELLPLRPVRIAQVRGRRVSEIEVRSPLAALRVPGVKKREALSLLRLPRLIARYRAALDPGSPERGADLDDRSLGDFGRLYFGESVLSRCGNQAFGRLDC